MEVKPGYKLTEIGVIPEDWGILALNDVCVKIQDGTHFSPKKKGSQYKYITSKNIGRGSLNLNNVDMIGAEEHKKIYKRCDVKEGDILLTKDGINTGNSAINTFTEEFSLLSSVAFIRLDSKHYDNRYLMYQILSNQGQNRIKNMISGNAITRLTLDKIKILTFPFPLSKQEQEIISEQIYIIDTLITSLEKLIEKKKMIKQGVMQELLTGKRRLPGFSGEWEKKSLGELVSNRVVSLGRGSVISKKSIDANKGNYPIYSSSIHNSGLFGRWSKYNFNEELITWSVDGGGNFFHRKKHRYSVTNVCGYMRVDQTIICYGFLYYQLTLAHKSLEFDYTIKAHPSVIKKLYTVLLPSLTEQKEIYKVLQDIDDGISSLCNKKNKYEHLKEAMMQELLTGRIRLI